MQYQNRANFIDRSKSFGGIRVRSKQRCSLNRLPVIGSRDHEGCMSPPMSSAGENNSRQEQFPLRRVLSNHDSGLTDLSLDLFSPQPEKTVYVCGASNESRLYHLGNQLTCSSSTVKERIISVFSSHFYVRSNHGRDQSDEKRRKSLNAITKCDVFVLILSERILEDPLAVAELIFAKLCQKVIVSVKEPSFQIDPSARERLEYTENCSALKTQLVLNQTDLRSNVFAEVVVTDNTNILVSCADGAGQKEELLSSIDIPFPLVGLFEGLCQEALIYSPSAHGECVAKLLYKLSDIDEERLHLPPVFESTSSTSTSGEDVGCYLPEKGNSDFALMVPPPQQSLSRVSSGYYSSPSPQHVNCVPDNMQIDQEADNKMSAEDFKKFEDCDNSAPIEFKSADCPLPSIPTTRSSPNSPTATSTDQFPIPPPMKPRSRSYETVANWLKDSLQEPPTFLETNYLVCPFQPGGPKVKPYLFRFPRDLEAEERQDKARRDSFSTDITLLHNKSEKGIDSSLRESPYSTPVTSPVPPSDGVPTVSEMKLMNHKPKLPAGVKPREKAIPVKQRSLPLIKTRTMSASPQSEIKLPVLTKRASSVDRNMTSKNSRQTKERKYLKLSTVRLEYSKSR